MKRSKKKNHSNIAAHSLAEYLGNIGHNNCEWTIGMMVVFGKMSEGLKLESHFHFARGVYHPSKQESEKVVLFVSM